MGKRLVDYITTDYVGAASRLNSRTKKRKIVAYVEGYDDVLFWRSLLSEVETDQYYFEVMLPSRTSLQKGKKTVLAGTLSKGFGENMIACVDADYDYLLQGATNTSKILCNNPYVFHTYAYAIESFQCYAPSLHEVCVMSTLNDRQFFQFEPYMEEYSRIVFPILVWSIWCYKNGYYTAFSMTDMANVIALPNIDLQNPQTSLNTLRNKVNVKQNRLQRQFPQAKGKWQTLRDELIKMGVTPETTYLYIRGHNLLEDVVLPLVETVCLRLKREREREIRQYAVHPTQYKNELSGYQHASAAPAEMLRKHTFYRESPLYQRIISDIKNRLEGKATDTATKE